MQQWVIIRKSIHATHHTDRMKAEKTHDYLNRCRKSMWQNSSPFNDKNPTHRRNRIKPTQHNNGHMWKTQIYHIQRGKTEGFLSKIKNKTIMRIFITSIQHNTELLVRVGREIKCIHTGKEEIKEDTNKWKDTSCSWIRRLNVVKMSISPKRSTDSMQHLSKPQQHFLQE